MVQPANQPSNLRLVEYVLRNVVHAAAGKFRCRANHQASVQPEVLINERLQMAAVGPGPRGTEYRGVTNHVIGLNPTVAIPRSRVNLLRPIWKVALTQEYWPPIDYQVSGDDDRRNVVVVIKACCPHSAHPGTRTMKDWRVVYQLAPELYDRSGVNQTMMPEALRVGRAAVSRNQAKQIKH